MAFYKVQFNEERGLYYPQAVVTGQPIETKEVAKLLSKMSTVSLADVLAVLAEMPTVLATFMSQGKSVRLDGLGTFRYTLDTEGVEDESQFDFQKQLKAVRVRFIPEREGGTTKGSTATRALVPTGIEWTELDKAADSSGDDEEETPGGGEDPLPGA